MRVLAVPGHGNLVVTGGLPLVGPTEHLGEAFKTWFNRMYMRVRFQNVFLLFCGVLLVLHTGAIQQQMDCCAAMRW
jgi:hypothetical protein